MTDVRPFNAVRYDTAKVELSRVIVPPYDVIAADEREAFYARDPYNAIRFELTRDVADEANTDYAEVGNTLAAWRREGVLMRDAVPGYYVMRQRFSGPGGDTLERVGFYAELGLEDYSERVVRPHERTLAGPKADRLKVLRASRANLSPVFVLYEDREGTLAQSLVSAFEKDSVGGARDEGGVDYDLARLADPDTVELVRSFMAQRPVVMADGHHRYETALAYRDERRQASASPDPDAPHESTLAYFANAYAPGTLLLPIHRVIRKDVLTSAPDEAGWAELLPLWRQKSVPLSGIEAIGKLLSEHLEPLAAKPAFAADAADGWLRILWRDEELDDRLMVRIVEKDVLGAAFGLGAESIRAGAVSFPKSAERAADEIRNADGRLAIYLNPLSPDDVFRVTAVSELMPQKSTFFFPKVPTGLVFRDHRD
jgi:uncharacterized protein (DUF1015 family)|tara:strand:- start:11694 stop:12974 length:1281 start_codon:yes stop_codon:yes gene_type:complete